MRRKNQSGKMAPPPTRKDDHLHPHITGNSQICTRILGDEEPEYEFLLFNYLLRFAHREGQIGFCPCWPAFSHGCGHVTWRTYPPISR